MGLLDLFGFGSKKAAMTEAVKAGAVIIDVREPSEYSRGNCPGSLNIPLGTIDSRVDEIKAKGKPVVTCCRSGMRSAQAKGILQAAGVEVYNGGSWQNVRTMLES